MGGILLYVCSKLWTARPICLRLLAHWMRAAASRTFCTAGSNRPIRTAMMAITTSSSIRVNAERPTVLMVFLRTIGLMMDDATRSATETPAWASVERTRPPELQEFLGMFQNGDENTVRGFGHFR